MNTKKMITLGLLYTTGIMGMRSTCGATLVPSPLPTFSPTPSPSPVDRWTSPSLSKEEAVPEMNKLSSVLSRWTPLFGECRPEWLDDNLELANDISEKFIACILRANPPLLRKEDIINSYIECALARGAAGGECFWGVRIEGDNDLIACVNRGIFEGKRVWRSLGKDKFTCKKYTEIPFDLWMAIRVGGVIKIDGQPVNFSSGDLIKTNLWLQWEQGENERWQKIKKLKSQGKLTNEIRNEILMEEVKLNN
jgi:hypothetical protein